MDKKTDIELALKYLDLPMPDRQWYEKAVHYLRGGDGGEHGLLLYGLVRKYHPQKIVDIGTARGFSAMCMAKGLVDNAEADGLVFTIDTIPSHQPYKWHRPGRQPPSDPAAGNMLTREQLLEPFDESLKQRITFLTGNSIAILSASNWKYGNLDFAFIDGEHTYQAVKEDFENVSGWLNPGGIVVFDDFHPGRVKFHRGKYELVRVKFPGVKRVVTEALNSGFCVVTTLPVKDEYGLAILKSLR